MPDAAWIAGLCFCFSFAACKGLPVVVGDAIFATCTHWKETIALHAVPIHAAEHVLSVKMLTSCVPGNMIRCSRMQGGCK